MSISGSLHEALIAYSTAKLHLADWTGASEDLLHVHAGLLIFGLAALISKQRLRSWIPISLVIAFAAANELADLISAREHGRRESVVDLANTVFWPALLFLLARRAKRPT